MVSNDEAIAFQGVTGLAIIASKSSFIKLELAFSDVYGVVNAMKHQNYFWWNEK